MGLLSLLLSINALALSALALFSKFSCEVIPTAVLSLIGICCTLIVGVSVIDSLIVHNIQKQIDKLSNAQKEIEKQEEDLKCTIKKYEDNSFIGNQISWGLALINWQPLTSFRYFVKGLEKSLIINHTKGIYSCLICMEQVPKAIKKYNIDITADTARKKGLPQISEDTKKLDEYKLIENRVKKVCEQMKPHYLSV